MTDLKDNTPSDDIYEPERPIKDFMASWLALSAKPEEKVLSEEEKIAAIAYIKTTIAACEGAYNYLDVRQSIIDKYGIYGSHTLLLTADKATCQPAFFIELLNLYLYDHPDGTTRFETLEETEYKYAYINTYPVSPSFQIEPPPTNGYSHTITHKFEFEYLNERKDT